MNFSGAKLLAARDASIKNDFNALGETVSKAIYFTNESLAGCLKILFPQPLERGIAIEKIVAVYDQSAVHGAIPALPQGRWIHER
ncbi:MAG: hypothetical protein M5U15_08555 [Kiritimatiellae bacterium]|nr:hypothetical protein [Kiritimatiellia bacterium]